MRPARQLRRLHTVRLPRSRVATKTRCGCSAKLEKQIKRHARLHSVSADDDAGDDKTRRCSIYRVDCVRDEYFKQDISINNAFVLMFHKNLKQLAKIY
jgi:hypothetical protein